MKEKHLKVISTSGLVKDEVFFILLLLGCYFLVLDARNDQVIRLLDFKQNSIKADPNGFLNNWSSLDVSPCSWKGVSCSPSGQVVEINLVNAGLNGNLYLSDLMALPNLARLYFGGNSFSGNLSSANQLCNFEILDLSANKFSEPVVLDSLLLSCSRLVTLNLSQNFIPSGSFKYGPSLSQLDLSRNRILDINIVNDLLSNCQSLKLFNISGSSLTGRLNFSLSSCKSLSILDLSRNRLSGDIPATLVSDAPLSLDVLDLSHNNITSNFSDFVFGNCFNLSVINLSFNCLYANGFPPSLSNCQNLEMLDLSHNAFEGKIPADLLGKLKSLKRLHLANNHFTGEIPSELGSLCSTLEELDLSWNKLIGGIPTNFALCYSLSTLNLGNNQLSGDFLSSVISKLSNLQYLYLAFNNLTGSIPISLSNCTQLKVLDIGSNDLTGNVPSVLCSNKTNSVLEKLLLPGNYLTGEVPSELRQCKNLKTIDLSFNLLTGTIPHEIWALPNISDLVMWANSLIGEIPDGICVTGGNLQTLILNNNFLTGNLPESLASCTNLVWISLSSNRLTGQIPSGIGNLINLAILQLGNNSITGPIPSGIGNCKSLIWLDLNSNNMSGSIPSEVADGSGYIQPGAVSGKQFAFVRNEGGTACRGAGGLVEFEEIRNDRLANYPMVHSCPSIRIYTGLTVYTFSSNGSMIYLDLSYNSFSGSIPAKLGSMSFLQVLNLGHNNLTGSIPFSFGGLKTVGVLDLSHNDLVGFIPPVLGGLSFLNDFDVSNNQLSGLIPTGGQLITFPASRYENNSGLCGVPLEPCGSENVHHHPLTSNTQRRKERMAFGVFFGIIASLISLLLLTFALYKIKKHQKVEEKKRDKYVETLSTSGSSSWKLSGVLEPLSINVAAFEKPLKKLTFAHLVEATNGFSADSLIGSGGFGEVYKAQLKDGCVVAIKKLVHVTFQGDREFVAEMETIGKIKHRNLVPLLGYCKIGEERLLVYEYMKWGSLESVLHEKGKGNLDWAARKKIAIGSARGLAFLHHSCTPHIIHRDMKSSNVLLDENFEARVSDFGMARLVNALDTHLSVSTLAGTPGYVPPEYYQSFRCTTKGDVYSYGVILMELLSGKRPTDTLEFGEDNNLVGWAKQLYREKRSHEILDSELTSASLNQTELLHYLNIAFQCLDDKSFRRPTMIQVMTMFKELHVDSESDILDGISVKNHVIEESHEKELLQTKTHDRYSFS